MILCLIKWEISLGEIVLATVTGFAAWYVGSALKRKQDRDIAGRELVRFFCRESLQLLASVSDTFSTELARTRGKFDSVGSHNINAGLQRLSNSLHTIKIAIERGKPKESKALMGPSGQLRILLDANEHLEATILDPIADEKALVSARQVEGAIRQTREALVALELDIVSRLE